MSRCFCNYKSVKRILQSGPPVVGFLAESLAPWIFRTLLD